MTLKDSNKKVLKSKKGKMLIAAATTSALVFSAMPASEAADSFTIKSWKGNGYNLQYYVENDSVTIFGVRDITKTDVTIPATIDGLPVKYLNMNHFNGYGTHYKLIERTQFINVKLPNTNVEFIDIPNSYRPKVGIRYEVQIDDILYSLHNNNPTIIEHAQLGLDGFFLGVTNLGATNIEEFTIPQTMFGAKINGVEYIKNANINKLILPESLNYIAALGASYHNSSVKYLDASKVKYLKRISRQSINMVAGSTLHVSQGFINGITDYNEKPVVEGVVKTLKLASDVKVMKKGLTSNFDTANNRINSTAVEILELNEGLEEIKEDAFLGLKLKEIILPSTLKTIGDNAFALNKETVETLVIPKSVESLGAGAFNSYVKYGSKWGGYQIKEVIIPSKYLSLTDSTFNSTGLNMIYAPLGSSTEELYKGKGFRPLDEHQNKLPVLIGNPTVTLNAEIGKDLTINLNDYFYDVNGDTLDFNFNPNSSLNVKVNSPGIYSVSPTETGIKPITITAQDWMGESETLTILLNVKEGVPEVINTKPTSTINNLEPVTLKVGEKKAVSVKDLFVDKEGDELTLSFEEFNSENETRASTNYVKFTQKLEITGVKEGTTSIFISANDGKLNSDYIELPITIEPAVTEPVNNKPTSKVLPEQSVIQGNPEEEIDFSNFFTDLDGDSLTYKLTSSTLGDSQLVVDGSVFNFSKLPIGNHRIVVVANDGKENSDEYTFMVNVAAEPSPEVKPPVLIGANPFSISVNKDNDTEGKTFNLGSYFKSSVDEPLTFKFLGNPETNLAEISLDENTGKLLVTGNAAGIHTVQVYAMDSQGTSATLSVQIQITENQVTPTTSVSHVVNPLTLNQTYHMESGQTMNVPMARLLANLSGDISISVNNSEPSMTTVTTTTPDPATFSINISGINNGFGYHEIIATDGTTTNSISINTIVSKSNLYVDEQGQVQIRDAEIKAEEEMYVVPLDQVFGTVESKEPVEYFLNVRKTSNSTAMAKARILNTRMASLNMATLFAATTTTSAIPAELNPVNLYSDSNASFDMVGSHLVVTGQNLSEYEVEVGTNVNGTLEMKPFQVKVLSESGSTSPDPKPTPEPEDNGGTGSDGSNNGSTGNTGGTGSDGSNNGGTGNTGGTGSDGSNNGGTGNTGGTGSDGTSEAISDELTLKMEVISDDKLLVNLEGDESITSKVEAVEIKGNEAYAIVDAVAYKIGEVPNGYNLDFSKSRAVRANAHDLSSVMHYTTDKSLILTTSNLKDVQISPRVSEPFVDVLDNHWFKADVEDAYNYIFTKGTGTSPAKYEPNAFITRGQFASMVARALEISESDTLTNYTLKDLKGKWYANDVQMLVDLGIITGYEDGNFGGSDFLTRQQASSIIVKTLQHLDVNVKTVVKATFADEKSISDYAKPAVNYLASEGVLINGQNIKFNPKENLTRAQMAKILMQSLKLSEKY